MITAWETTRNLRQNGVNWQFTNEKARINITEVKRQNYDDNDTTWQQTDEICAIASNAPNENAIKHSKTYI